MDSAGAYPESTGASCEADLPIAAIAIEVRFADQSNFTKVFQRQVGVAPKRWQRDRKIIGVPDGAIGKCIRRSEL